MRPMTFAVGSFLARCCGDGCQPVVMEGFLDVPDGGGSEALVDGESVPKVRSGCGGVAVPQVAVADSFERACLFQGGADLAGDG